MGVKNVLQSCAGNFGNTGFGECFTDFGMPKFIFFVPRGFKGDLTSIATIKADLEALLLEDVPSQRGYPVNGIVNVTSNSEDVVVQTFNTGAIAKVRDGNYDMTFQWIQGGFCLLYGLLKGNGKNQPFFIGTDNGFLIGTDTGDGLLSPIKPNFVNANKFTWSDGTNVSAYTLRLNFEPAQVNQNVNFVDFSSDGGLSYFEGLQGLQNVNLAQAAARALGVLKVKASTSCGSVDMYDLYSADLAVVGAWVATNRLTGNVITITSVAVDANAKAWTITLNTSDPDYTATAGDILISLAGPTELAAIDVVGYESNKLAQ